MGILLYFAYLIVFVFDYILFIYKFYVINHIYWLIDAYLLTWNYIFYIYIYIYIYVISSS